MRRTLAIETSCDDTSLAFVVEDNGKFYCQHMLTDTQKFHNNYGGVVPEMASRAHADRILPVFDRLLYEVWYKKENLSDSIDCISVTTYPWLPWSLMIGKTFGSLLSQWYNIPLIAVNHLYGHVLSVLLGRSISDIQLPMVVLSASGWHSDLYLIDNYQTLLSNNNIVDRVWPYLITKLWWTRDDAAGETFDKVARLLWWPYPGGKRIWEKADIWSIHSDHENQKTINQQNWNTTEIDNNIDIKKKLQSPYRFKRIMLEEWSFDFSFSGMKSQAYTFIERIRKSNLDKIDLTHDQIAELAYEFQESITDVLSDKLINATQKFHAKTIWLVWWVSANIRLREKLQNHNIILPTKFEYCVDNAAMIWVVWLLDSIENK